MWALLLLPAVACLTLQDSLPNSITEQTWVSYQQPAEVFLEVKQITNTSITGVFLASAPAILFATNLTRIPCDTPCCNFTDEFLMTGGARQQALSCQVSPLATDLSNPDFRVTVEGTAFTVETTTPISTLGLMVMLGSGPALTLTTLRAPVSYDRRMVSSAVVQLESDPTQTWARVVMTMRWPNTTLVGMRWRQGDGPWQSCNSSVVSQCPYVGPACVGTTYMDSMQVWIPGVGANTTIWATVQSGSIVGRVMARAGNTIVFTNCAPAIKLWIIPRVQVLRGLQQTVVWDGPIRDFIDLGASTSLDALVTVWMWLEDVTLDTLSVTSSNSGFQCGNCQTEVLISSGSIKDRNACHVIGVDDDAWMGAYTGVVNTSLVSDQPNGATMGMWLRPTWKGPYSTMNFTLKIK